MSPCCMSLVLAVILAPLEPALAFQEPGTRRGTSSLVIMSVGTRPMPMAVHREENLLGLRPRATLEVS